MIAHNPEYKPDMPTDPIERPTTPNKSILAPNKAAAQGTALNIGGKEVSATTQYGDSATITTDNDTRGRKVLSLICVALQEKFSSHVQTPFSDEGVVDGVLAPPKISLKIGLNGSSNASEGKVAATFDAIKAIIDELAAKYKTPEELDAAATPDIGRNDIAHKLALRQTQGMAKAAVECLKGMGYNLTPDQNRTLHTALANQQKQPSRE